ncbi:gluconokinase [Agromyces sp. SYSU T0242]|uniref:gluconokinase n=1 Tax=Agromyces litoreus TaxID=3158561 RepID=UPI0033994B4F
MTPIGAPGPLVVMGVSASGKSTVGTRLAERLGVPFVDGDDLHPASNVEKMRAGVPLDDADRAPWLDRVAATLVRGADSGIVVACSALRRWYRDRIRTSAPGTAFVHLELSQAALRGRARARVGHFMPPALLASQLATLEPLEADETGMTLDAAQPVDVIVERIVARLGDAG